MDKYGLSAEGMPAVGNQWSLFGFDLREAWGAFLAGWREAMARPWLAWLVPDEVVRLVGRNGESEIRRGAQVLAATSAVEAVAVELPEALVLESQRVLPRLPLADVERALALHVASMSPFDEQDTVWGWSKDALPGDKLALRVVMASRAQIDAYLESRVAEFGGGVPEVWFDHSRPVVIRGFGERARLRRRARRGMLSAALLAVSSVLLLALASVPVIRAHERADQARAAYEGLQRDAQPILAKKEQLAALTGGLEDLDRQIAAYVAPLPVLARLTSAVPDNAMVDRLTFEQGKLRIWGQAEDAAALLNQIGQTRGFYNVRSPSAIQRNARTGKESFAIEMDLRPEGSGSSGGGGS
ncbi:MAG: PilN domain-containing protein [Rhodocyclaceae bacterium]|nr:PilN domain-containing protein [Rhodocyclaceae bacterium]